MHSVPSSTELPKWQRYYAVSGHAEGSKGLLSADFQLPANMDSTLLSGPIGFAYHLIGFNEAREGVGLKLKLTNDRGAAIERVNLIGPAEGGGTSTITLPLQRPIRWLTLPHGAVESSLIDAGNYMVRIERTAIATWRMDFDHVSGEQKVEWFHGGWVVFTADAATPPWRSLHYKFELSNSQGQLAGEISLVETPDNS